MTWIALADAAHRRFSKFGIGIDRTECVAADDSPSVQMRSGTVLIETTLPETDRPELLFGYEKTDAPGHRFLAIRALPTGGLSCLFGFGNEVRHVVLTHAVESAQKPVWISVAWDAAQKTLRLALEIPGTPQFAFKSIAFSQPLFVSDLRDAIVALAHLPGSTRFIAISSTCEPLGFQPGILVGTKISTPFGPKDIAQLKRGDLVTTTDGDQVPVLHAVRRKLPARGTARPIRLRAPYFNFRQDCTVSAMQCLEIRGTHVEYAQGCEAVLIPSGYLENGISAVAAQSGPIADYAQIVTPSHTSVSVAQGALETQFVGRLRRDTAKCAQTMLGQIPRRDWPEHISTAAPVLDHSASLFLEQRRFG